MPESYPLRVKEHPSIGPIRGIGKVPGVTQFLGVQYATLKDRFSRAELINSYPTKHSRVQNGILDATKIAAIPLSPANGCQWEHSLIQHSLPSPQFEQLDTECLTLNLAVPHTEANGSPWPVLALVHGGAFATGSSSYPQYDLARIVQMSVEMGQPIIAVGINYRLGVPGFLHSSAMKAAGYKPNNGLDDQRVGLLWIQRHIAGFNGDPKLVTYIGESSGAASGTFHLHSAVPLFSQLIAMSGSSLVKAKQPEVAEKSFNAALDLLGRAAEGMSDAEKVERFLTASMEDVREKIGRKVPITPIVDGELIPQATSYSLMADAAETAKLFPGIEWCKRIMVGDCQMDGNAYAPRVATRTDILTKTLAANLAAALSPIDPELTPSIIREYGLDTTTSANTSESLGAVLDLATDICFALGARTFAKSWSARRDTTAFLYHFNVPNPWDGPWKGHATHILDIAFVLQNYRNYLPPGQLETANRFTRDVVTFVHGGTPWPAYQTEQGGAMVYFAQKQGAHDESYFSEHEAPEKTGRRVIIQTLMKQKCWDKVMDAWEMFMKGPK